MLTVAGLDARYGGARVLNGITLDLRPGEVHAVLGRNGMGKTTLVRAMMGLSSPTVTAGEARLDGARITGLPPHRIARLGVALVPQGRRLWNAPIATYPDVDQFWGHDPETYMRQPSYSRTFQGVR